LSLHKLSHHPRAALLRVKNIFIPYEVLDDQVFVSQGFNNMNKREAA